MSETIATNYFAPSEFLANKLPVTKVTSYQSYQLPKLPVTKVTSYQSYQLPKLPVTKVTSYQSYISIYLQLVSM